MSDENENENEDGGNTKEPQTFESFMADQSEAVQGLYKQNVDGLKKTISATRTERDTMASDLRDAAAKLEKGSDAEKRLTDMAGKLDLAERRAGFAEDATKPEIGCTNPKMAYLVAEADGLFDSKGNPNWDAIKKAAPESFKEATADAGGGRGTDALPPGKGDMNRFIRVRAGRQE